MLRPVRRRPGKRRGGNESPWHADESDGPRCDLANSAADHLIDRGYLPPDFDPLRFPSDRFEAAIAAYQRDTGILVADGWWGPVTAKVANLPRCGVKEGQLAAGVGLARWRKAMPPYHEPITWTILSWDDAIPANTLTTIFQQAFRAWNLVANIKFEQQSGPSDIEISFGHIDGAGRTLAWSELPVTGGGPLQQMYDLSEIFVASTPRVSEIFFLAVATHEIGHAIGIEHIAGVKALMNPIYSAAIDKPIVPDIDQAVKRYGRPVVVSVPDVPASPDTPENGGNKVKLLAILQALVAFSQTDLGKQIIDLIIGLINKPSPSALTQDYTASWGQELQQIETALQNAGHVPDAT